MDARLVLDTIADYIETRALVAEYDEETQESILSDIVDRFQQAIDPKAATAAS